MPEERVKLAPEPQFSYLRMAWKGLRPALTTAGVAGATAFALAIDTKTLTDLGVPTIVALMVVEAARNWSKQRRDREGLVAHDTGLLKRRWRCVLGWDPGGKVGPATILPRERRAECRSGRREQEQ